jgi:hypothetical protein
MSIITRSSQFKINIRGLILRRTQITLRPIYTRQLLRSHKPHQTPSTNSPRGITSKSLVNNKPFEEESLPGYEPEQFYPVNIGDIIKSRYRVIGKLGFGANSTAWFCRDLSHGSDNLLSLRCDRLISDLAMTSMLHLRCTCVLRLGK